MLQLSSLACARKPYKRHPSPTPNLPQLLLAPLSAFLLHYLVGSSPNSNGDAAAAEGRRDHRQRRRVPDRAAEAGRRLRRHGADDGHGGLGEAGARGDQQGGRGGGGGGGGGAPARAVDGGRGPDPHQLHRRARRGALERARARRRSEADGEELPAAVAQLPPAGREARRLHRRRAAAHPRSPLPLGQPVVEDRRAAAGSYRQRDQELLADACAEARQAAQLRRQQRTLQGRHAIPLDAAPRRARRRRPAPPPPPATGGGLLHRRRRIRPDDDAGGDDDDDDERERRRRPPLLPLQRGHHLVLERLPHVLGIHRRAGRRRVGGDAAAGPGVLVHGVRAAAPHRRRRPPPPGGVPVPGPAAAAGPHRLGAGLLRGRLAGDHHHPALEPRRHLEDAVNTNHTLATISFFFGEQSINQSHYIGKEGDQARKCVRFFSFFYFSSNFIIEL